MPTACCSNGPPTASPRALLAGVVGALLIWSAPLAADPLRAARDDLDRVRSELVRLRQIQPVQAQSGASRFAQFEVRLGQLEEELRRLTGRIEQLEFGQRTVEGRIDQLIADLDQRLAALEAARSQGQPQAQGGPAPSEPGGGDTRAQEALQALVTEPDQPQQPAPAQEGTLGRVPESAVSGLPRPDLQAIRPPDESSFTPQEQYDSAVELLRAGDYQGAENGLNLFLELHPDDPLASNAAYWLAESFYVRKNYAAAAAAFARNYQTYGQKGGKAPDNLLKLGMSLFALGEAEKACVSYDQLSQAFADLPAHIEQAVARERDRAQCPS